MNERSEDIMELLEELGDVVRIHESDMRQLRKREDGIVQEAVRKIEELEIESIRKRIGG